MFVDGLVTEMNCKCIDGEFNLNELFEDRLGIQSLRDQLELALSVNSMMIIRHQYLICLKTLDRLQ